MKKLTVCMNCGEEKVREIYKDELGEYIVCNCGSTCDV